MQRTGRELLLEVDGGVKEENIAAIAQAGADTFVAGSAIFLHVARPDFAPTEGCIAVARDILAGLLGLLGPGSAITIRA